MDEFITVIIQQNPQQFVLTEAKLTFYSGKTSNKT